MADKAYQSRVREIEKGFARLGINTQGANCCQNTHPSFQVFSMLETVETVARPNSSPHEVLDAKPESLA